MVYQALLFSTDERSSRVVGQILSELEFTVDACTEPFAAVKQITNQHYDALVVDCDNEQNAALLFKSARNSNSNSASLAVALVRGQGGIAKAFRIGANLVLSKPIHIEQSKGTLRTAKGLLRKAEAAKAGAATSSAPKFEAPFPELPAPPVQAAFSVGSVASGTLELQEEQFPELGATEAALLESMPEPSPLVASPLSGSPSNAWQTPAQPPVEPMAIQTLAGAASAAAPAKELPAIRTSGKSIPEDRPLSPDRENKRVSSSSDSRHADFDMPEENDEPAFGQTGLGATESAKPGNRNFLIAAVLVLAAGSAIYYGWPQLSPLLTSLPIVQKYLAPQPAPHPVPAQTTQPATSTQPQGAPPAATEAQPVAGQTAASQTTGPVISNSSSPANANPSAITVSPAEAPSTDAGGSAQNPVHLAPEVAADLLVGKVEPTYPPAALQQHLEGSVELRAEIDKDGSPSKLKVISGKAPLTTAAAAAVRQWKYKPYEINGQPTEFQTEITVDFKLP